MIHYLYKIVNNVNNKFYYGIHSTNNIDDGYFGSGKRLKTAIKKYGKQNFSKYIVEYFDSRESLLQREQEIITNELLLSGDCYNLVHGGSAGQLFYVPVKDKDGNTFSVDKNDPRYLSGELVHVLKSINKNKIVVKNKDGNTFSVDKNDPRYLSGELISINANMTTMIDKDGNKIKISTDDPRYLSGELVGVATDCAMKGKLLAKDKNGNKFVVSTDDPRYLSGELVGTSKDTQWVNKNNIEKMISHHEVSNYLNDGWQKGRIKKCWIHKNMMSKLIHVCDLDEYLNDDWKTGKH